MVNCTGVIQCCMHNIYLHLRNVVDCGNESLLYTDVYCDETVGMKCLCTQMYTVMELWEWVFTIHRCILWGNCGNEMSLYADIYCDGTVGMSLYYTQMYTVMKLGMKCHCTQIYTLVRQLNELSLYADVYSDWTVGMKCHCTQMYTLVRQLEWVVTVRRWDCGYESSLYADVYSGDASLDAYEAYTFCNQFNKSRM